MGLTGHTRGGREAQAPVEVRTGPRSEPAWPLRWELRAVDARRRRGWVWEGTGELPPRAATPADPSPPPAAPPDRPLALLVGRSIYDAGQMLSRSPDLREVTPKPFVELHPHEAAARGLAEGDEVSVASHRASVRTRVRISDATPPGAAFMLFDQPGLRTNALLDLGEPVTFVQISA